LKKEHELLREDFLDNLQTMNQLSVDLQAYKDKEEEKKNTNIFEELFGSEFQEHKNKSLKRMYY
jgi:AMMECR1 domain-containing protein